MEIRRLRYFLAVARELNFTKAADLLRISPPSLSQQIKVLEREIGRPLFERSTHHTRLTTAGETLVPIAARLTAELDALPALIRKTATETRIRVAIPDALNPRFRTFLTVVHRELAAGYRIDLRQMPSLNMEAEILAHTTDLAFSHVPAGHAALRSVPLYTEPMVVVLDAAQLTDRKPLRLADLRGFAMVLGPKHWELSPQIRQDLTDGGIIADPALRFSDAGGMLLMIASSKRFTFVPAQSDLAHDAEREGFAVLPMTEEGMTLTTYLIHRPAETWLNPVVDTYRQYTPAS